MDFSFMKRASLYQKRHLLLVFTVCVACWMDYDADAQSTDGLVPRFAMENGGLALERAAQAGTFLEARGRRAGVFGYEKESVDVWTYPLQVVRDVRLAFHVDEEVIDGSEVMTQVTVRPEATTLTYTHDAFTVRQTLLVPVDAMGVLILLDVESDHPLEVSVAFQPELRLMNAADPMTSTPAWNDDRHAYTFTDAGNTYVGMIGAPGASPESDHFLIHTTPDFTSTAFIPIVIAGSATGPTEAQATYQRLLENAETIYRETANHYDALLKETVQLRTPDARLNKAFARAKIDLEKSLATDPVRGITFPGDFRTSGDGRSGFSWQFSRDALWTTLAFIASGNLAAAATLLDVLEQHQQDDGRIPYEIVPSETPLTGISGYPYAWTSVDASPLFIIAHAALWQRTGDLDALRGHWPAIRQAYAFTAATDTDGNHLVENTDVGPGTVEEGALPASREEIYLQGLWIEAARNVAEMAQALGDEATAAEARATAERALETTETIYWNEDAGYYAAASDTAIPFPDNTVLSAVPMAWEHLHDPHAQRTIDHLGSHTMAADRGTRLLSSASESYDPDLPYLATAQPLYTGWAALAAYRYDRPHVGYRALMANATATLVPQNAPAGKTSFSQTEAPAMLLLPAVRGMLGLDARAGGRVLRFAPQLPADWDATEVNNVAVGTARYNIAYRRQDGGVKLIVMRSGEGGAEQLEMEPAFPLDEVVQTIRNNRYNTFFNLSEQGDQQRVIVKVDAEFRHEVTYNAKPGTGVYVPHDTTSGASPEAGFRLLRARAGGGALHLLVEGRAGHTYTLYARTPHHLEGTDGVLVTRQEGQDTRLDITFEGPADTYIRRDLQLPLHKQ